MKFTEAELERIYAALRYRAELSDPLVQKVERVLAQTIRDNLMEKSK